MTLSPAQSTALAYLAKVPAGSWGYVRTATAKALQARGLVYASRTKPGDAFGHRYMRCSLVA